MFWDPLRMTDETTPETPGAVPPPPPPGTPPAWPGQGDGAQSPWPTQAQPYEYQPPKKKRFSVGIVARIVIAVLVFGGLGAWRSFERDHLKKKFTRPTTIGNATLVTTPEMLKIADDARKEVENVHRAISGVYAVDGQPAFILVAGDADDDSGRSIYDTFKSEVEADNDGTTVSAPSDYGAITCATVTDSDGPSVACFWGSKRSDGLLIHFGTSNVATVAKTAELARAGVEA